MFLFLLGSLLLSLISTIISIVLFFTKDISLLYTLVNLILFYTILNTSYIISIIHRLNEDIVGSFANLINVFGIAKRKEGKKVAKKKN